MEFRRPRGIFEQIGDHVCNSILSGVFREGDKIPSVRQMAADLQVNPNTMMRAYAVLQEQNILLNQRGIGFFVADGARARILARQREAFLREDLPLFFDTIRALEIDLAEIQKLYDERGKGCSRESIC